MNIWQGKAVRLRGLREDDWKLFKALDADSDLQRRLDRAYPPRCDERTQDVAKKAVGKGPEGDSMQLVIETPDGTPVGTIDSHHCDSRTGNFMYGISLLSDHRGKGYAREAVLILLRYFFGELRYQKVTIGIHSYNDRSVEFHEKLGFKHEGRVRRNVYAYGRHHDEILMGLTVEEFMADLLPALDES